MKTILIGGAWPYANGSLHIGHIAALLPGDVLARYYRAKDKDVYYVSGSDCHGTPITIRARQEGCTPAKISGHYHEEFCQEFRQLGFTYDCYTKTSDEKHVEFVKAFHKTLYKSPYIEERTVRQAYCPNCQKILTDRLVIGICPSCGSKARGDQCDACGAILDADTIQDAACANCGSALEFGETTQLYLLITKLEAQLRQLADTHPHWRRNAIAFTNRYLHEGLRDRAITRDLDWGIEVPKDGYEEKKIYIWAENVLGYLSAAYQVCKERDVPFTELFGKDADTRHYYVHGKDNIPFHTIILPALLLAEGEGFHLPDDIISSEHMTLDGQKISTSSHHAIWAKELLASYHPDSIRYFFLANGPEKRDTDFSLREFVKQNNSELVGCWGNYVNRTLVFIQKYLDNEIPCKPIRSDIRQKVLSVYEETGRQIEHGAVKDALCTVLELVRYGNRFYDSEEPWNTRISAPDACADAICSCTYMIGNLAVLLHPFLPFSSRQVLDWLGLTEAWQEQTITRGATLPQVSILFERLEE